MASIRVDGSSCRGNLARYDVRALMVASTDRLVEDYRRERVEVNLHPSSNSIDG